ncbi:SCO2523 family variant P-loop protein [Streptomyces purpurascens]|uniref:SCO2523 family variant P-loop protein n=1 Tax=Streptomyces purpurascens TaxID=1924 RepID=UPI0016751D0E|nr:SCO2523 family variant P-loop protein [Streptomyces purpurascens]MCE7051700.1 SCO2523 family variant P-loop protein [Streptomyces purpurascens]GHA11432.1 DNA-binding protein [Streptomyces purpurascens]
MLIFAASDKGGAGRSVTSANLAYRRALAGDEVCYLDFDFGSPTASAVFDVPEARRAAEDYGLHAYLKGEVVEPARIDVWAETEHWVLRNRPSCSGRLVLMPGDLSGGDFATTENDLRRCVDLLLKLHHEFDLIVVDLRAGRSYAVDLALAATAQPEMRAVPARWLVFHRWTRQHVAGAAHLVFGRRGLVASGVARGHDADALRGAIRFVRSAVPDPDSPLWSQARPAQSVWMRVRDGDLEQLASEHGMGRSQVLGSVPFEPVLQWREQLITDEDVLDSQIADMTTWQALRDLAARLTDDRHWEVA